MPSEDEITAKINPIDIEAEWVEKKGIMPSCELSISVAGRTDLGLVRENNEDKFEIFEPDEPEILAIKGSLYAVADGMGGHAAGQIASEIALKTVVKSYYGDTSDDVEASIVRSFKRANTYVHDSAQTIGGRSGMGTTCTTLIIRNDKMFMAHVGDSRLYRVRDGFITQMSEDHSWVAEQVRLGLLTETEAAFSPFRNVITRSIGSTMDVEVDFLTDTVQSQDVYVICSDGLSGYVSDGLIQETVQKWSPALAALKLVDCAYDGGGGDNITVVVVKVNEIKKPY